MGLKAKVKSRWARWILGEERKIDGKIYTLHLRTNSETKAVRVAKQLKAGGFSVRIAKPGQLDPHCFHVFKLKKQK